MGPFTRAVVTASGPLAVPVLSFPGAALAGRTVRDLVTSGEAQAAAQLALHRRFGTACLMSAMDLSVEAEEFGSEIRFADDEVPTVINRLVTDEAGAAALEVPGVGSRRSAVYLDTVRRLVAARESSLVLAGMIGPFSLAGRLFGVSEALLATATDPEMVRDLVTKATQFLAAYARAFKDAGADGVIVAEPTAGLLSPPAVRAFSAPAVQTIVRTVQDDTFDVILHNCGARPSHLDATFEAGAAAYHFGSPMDMAEALGRAPAGAVVCGNLDPAAVFHDSEADVVRARTAELLRLRADHPLFVPSSGCDIPAQTPLENLEAFFSTVSQAR